MLEACRRSLDVARVVSLGWTTRVEARANCRGVGTNAGTGSPEVVVKEVPDVRRLVRRVRLWVSDMRALASGMLNGGAGKVCEYRALPQNISHSVREAHKEEVLEAGNEGESAPGLLSLRVRKWSLVKRAAPPRQCKRMLPNSCMYICVYRDARDARTLQPPLANYI
jgi:hypothetical protein